MIGYSDVDVLLYVIMDVLFGVVCLGDIGMMFLNIDFKNWGKDFGEMFRVVYLEV